RLFPIGRSLFAVLFVHEFFRFVRDRQKQRGDEYPWQPNKLAWFFIGANFIYVMVYLTADAAQPHWFLSLLTFIMVQVVQYYVFYKVQLIIIRIDGDPFSQENRKLTLQYQMRMIFGAMFWVNVLQTIYLHATGKWPQRVPIEAPAEPNPGQPL